MPKTREEVEAWLLAEEPVSGVLAWDRPPKRRIAGVAILYQGQQYSLAPPARHHDLIRDICAFLDVEGLGEMEQGFIDQDHKFVDRKTALQVARDAGQLKPDEPVRAGVLFSENLW